MVSFIIAMCGVGNIFLKIPDQLEVHLFQGTAEAESSGNKILMKFLCLVWIKKSEHCRKVTNVPNELKRN